jgi:hypothetical protein
MKKLLTVLTTLTIVACGKPENGNDGSNGADGTTTVVHEYVQAPIDPNGIKKIIPICGIIMTGAQVAIKLNDGTLLISISNNNQGEFTRIGYIFAGRYKTTDQLQCNFEVYLDSTGETQIRKL